MNFNTLKRKLLCLIERIKLSENSYRTMLVKARMYDGMISCVDAKVEIQYTEATDESGFVYTSVPKSKTYQLNVDIWQMLAEGGIRLDKRFVNLQVDGFDSGREYVEKTGKCPMCEDCPDNCPIEEN